MGFAPTAVALRPERWNRVKVLFESALDRGPHERSAFLRAACAGDRSLLAELEKLLSAHEKTGPFLDTVAIPGALLAARSQPRRFWRAKKLDHTG
jgi:hypothetical protein